MANNPFADRANAMAEGCYIEQAAGWARAMIEREKRGNGDTPNAMRRIARRYSIPRSLLWGLLYRKPKGIFHDRFMRLKAAYVAECERQERLLAEERARFQQEIANEKAGLGMAAPEMAVPSPEAVEG